MRARQLEVFCAVMRAGSVTGAAAILNISQPALSQILLRTEDDLGFALFERIKGKLIPTPEAHELFPEVERIFAGLEGLRRKTADLRLGHAGLVRVIASGPPATAIVPAAFQAFRRRYPAIALRSDMAPLNAVTDMLRQGDAGLGLAMEDHLPPDIAVEVLGHVGFLCLLPEGHPLGRRATVPLEGLAGETLISYRVNTRPAEELDKSARAKNIHLAVAIEIDVSISAVSFVQAGLGVAIVDSLLPWQSFTGVITRPLESSACLPASLLTLASRPLSLAEDAMRADIRVAARHLFSHKAALYPTPA